MIIVVEVHLSQCHLHHRVLPPAGGGTGGQLLLPGLPAEGEDVSPQQEQNDSPPHSPDVCRPHCEKMFLL